jgi:hypothetical protein
MEHDRSDDDDLNDLNKKDKGKTIENMSSKELLDAVEKEGILVYKNDSADRDGKRQVKLTNGEEAYFALLAQDMLNLAEKYKRDVEHIHRLFF